MNKRKNLELEIIVVDDNSNDGTLDKLRNNNSLYDFLIESDKNLGKGGDKKGLEKSIRRGKFLFKMQILNMIQLTIVN